MDITKVKQAIDEAHKQLNGVIDTEFQARRLQALRTLSLAANALTLAETHLNKAVTQTTPKEPKQTTTSGNKGKK